VKKITSWVFLLALVIAVPVLAQPTLTANPNPLPAGTTTVTISWNAPGHALVYVYVGSATALCSPQAAPPVVVMAICAPVRSFISSTQHQRHPRVSHPDQRGNHHSDPQSAAGGSHRSDGFLERPGYSRSIFTRIRYWPGVHVRRIQRLGRGQRRVSRSGSELLSRRHATGTFLASASVLGDWDIPTANQSRACPSRF